MKKLGILIIVLLGLCGCARPDFSSSHVEEENKTEVKLEGELVVHFLDVGQADAMVLELPNRELMLIDAGESQSAKKIIDYIKNLGYNRIDYVIGTHPHADHIGGMAEVIKAFEIGTIYMPKVVATSKTYENLLLTIQDKGLKIKTGKSGVQVFDNGNLKGEIVAPNKEKYSGYNNYSIVLKLVYGDTSYLFMGDAEALSESEIMGEVDVDVLKVGHHGSDTSSSHEFLDKVQPKYAIISVGADNKYKHPSSDVVKRLEKYTTNIYRTDENETIKVISNGKDIKVITEK
ncbi:MAG: MBL fold metallo-hydrolase [Bacilli bacterium]|nr:MBL fold metallo-hydrolase [Bacilli bacterium]